MMRAVASMAVSGASGALLVNLFWPERDWKSHFALRGALSVILGLGLSSALFFVSLMLFDGLLIWTALLDFAVLFGLFYLWYKRREACSDQVPEKPAKWSSIRIILQLLFALFACAAVWNAFVQFVITAEGLPGGAWDALFVWNLRAKFLAGGNLWRNLFCVEYATAHPEYPLLLSSTIGRLWVYRNNPLPNSSNLTAITFMLSGLALLYGAVRSAASYLQGVVALVLLTAGGVYGWHAACQYSDQILSYYMLATVALLSLVYTKVAPRSALVLAGFSAGCAVWTKEEGLPFIALTFVIALFSLLWSKESRAQLKGNMLRLALGAAPMIVVLLVFRIFVAPATGLAGASSERGFSLAKLLDQDRFVFILKNLLPYFAWSGEWYFSPTYMLAGYFVLMGLTRDRLRRFATVFYTLILLGMICAYLAAYQTSPYDLNWLLGTTATRLMAQVWPTFVFLYFLILKSPEEVWRRMFPPTRA